MLILSAASARTDRPTDDTAGTGGEPDQACGLFSQVWSAVCQGHDYSEPSRPVWR